MSLKVDYNETMAKDRVKIWGRGDLHLGILIEKMRWEGFEMSISPPEVLTQKNEKGEEVEPIEICAVEVEPEHTSTVIDLM